MHIENLKNNSWQTLIDHINSKEHNISRNFYAIHN